MKLYVKETIEKTVDGDKLQVVQVEKSKPGYSDFMVEGNNWIPIFSKLSQ